MNILTGIYKITSPSGKVYIGQSKNIHSRILKYQKHHCKNQIKLYSSLEKYKWENHKFEILQICKPEELNSLEIQYIKEYNSVCRFKGLNLKEGGNSGGKLTEEVKDKIRFKAIGRKASKETKDKMSETRKGKKFTKEHKENLNKTKFVKVFTFIDNKKVTFNSILEACELTGYKKGAISSQINRNSKNKRSSSRLKFYRELN